MRKVAIRIALIFALLGVMIGVAPPQAQALPSLNPLCWIADKNNPGVREGCKGHDWSWPHWGGGRNYDSRDRGCGGSSIYSDPWWMSAQDLRAFNFGRLVSRHGIERSELVLISSIKYTPRFRYDYYVYTWKAQHHHWVSYDGSTYMEYYTPIKYVTVECDTNGHVR